MRSGSSGPVHTIDARPAYGGRASLATAVRLLRRVQRRQIIHGRRRKDHHARHQPKRRGLGTATSARAVPLKTTQKPRDLIVEPINARRLILGDIFIRTR
jgi:hypothetical protein